MGPEERTAACDKYLNTTPVLLTMWGGLLNILIVQWAMKGGASDVFKGAFKAFFAWRRGGTLPDTDLDIRMGYKHEDAPPPQAPGKGGMSLVLTMALYFTVVELTSTVGFLRELGSLDLSGWDAYNCYARLRLWDPNTRTIINNMVAGAIWVHMNRGLWAGGSTQVRALVLASLLGGNVFPIALSDGVSRPVRVVLAGCMALTALSGAVNLVTTVPALLTHAVAGLIVFPLSLLETAAIVLVSWVSIRPFWGNSLTGTYQEALARYGALVVYVAVAAIGSQASRWTGYGGSASYFGSYTAEWASRTWDAYLNERLAGISSLSDAIRRVHDIV